MSEPLVWVLSLAVAVLTTVLVPLILQLRRTAQAVERLADSAAADLHRISEDVRATREKVEALSASVQAQVDRVDSAMMSVSGFAGVVRSLFGGGRGAEGWSGWAALIGSLLSSLLTAWSARTSKGEKSHE